MSILTTLTSVARRLLSAGRTQRCIARLRRDESALVRTLGEAFGQTLSGSLAPEEEEWIERIESLRDELYRCTTELEIADYGAVSPTGASPRGDEQQGTVVTRSIAETCKTGSVKPERALVLFKLVRGFRPSVCLEMGTSLGISAAYQAAALKLTGQGRLVTLEGAASLVSAARENLARLGLDNVTVVHGRFQDTLGEVARAHAPVDYAFIDGHHEEQATLAYFNETLPFLSPTALLVFDDISWSDGMRRAWWRIAADERVKLAFDLDALGVCLVDAAHAKRATLKLRLF